MKILRSRALLLAGAAGLTLLTACTSSAPADGVEQQIVSQLGAVTADCPDDLDATVTCAATDDAGPFDVTVTVTSLSDGDINFDMERVGAAPPVEPADVAGDVVDE